MYKNQDIFSDFDISDKILEERNRDVMEIERDVANISEIMLDLSNMINSQGESIESAVENVEKALENIEESVVILERTEEYHVKNNKLVKNLVLVIGGISLGALGFIAGPVVGIATLITGAITGSGIAIIT